MIDIRQSDIDQFKLLVKHYYISKPYRDDIIKRIDGLSGNYMKALMMLLVGVPLDKIFQETPLIPSQMEHLLRDYGKAIGTYAEAIFQLPELRKQPELMEDIICTAYSTNNRMFLSMVKNVIETVGELKLLYGLNKKKEPLRLEEPPKQLEQNTITSYTGAKLIKDNPDATKKLMDILENKPERILAELFKGE